MSLVLYSAINLVILMASGYVFSSIAWLYRMDSNGASEGVICFSIAGLCLLLCEGLVSSLFH